MTIPYATGMNIYLTKETEISKCWLEITPPEIGLNLAQLLQTPTQFLLKSGFASCLQTWCETILFKNYFVKKYIAFFLGMLDVELCSTILFSSKSSTFNKLYWSIFLPWQYWEKIDEWLLALDSYCCVKISMFLTYPLGKLVCHPDMSAVSVEQWVFFYN